MVPRALIQAGRMVRVPRRTACRFRYSSTTSRQPTTKSPARPADQKSHHDGQTLKPYSQASKPYGQTPKPYGQTPRPYGQAPKPYGQTPKSNTTERRPSMAPASPFYQKVPEWEINPMVSAWAKEHDVGFPEELKNGKVKDLTAKVNMIFKFSPRHVFRSYHTHLFMGHQKVATAYTLYRYEQCLGVPLWIHIDGSHNPRPVVRNFARRRVREGIRAALAERGYTFEGRVADAGETGTGGAQDAPKKDLKGTVFLYVKNPVTVFNQSREKHIQVGREIVSWVESRQSTGQSAPQLPRRPQNRRY